MIVTWLASSFMISWSRVAVSPVSFFGGPAFALDEFNSANAGRAAADAPAARVRKERREGTGAGLFSRLSFLVTSVIVFGLLWCPVETDGHRPGPGGASTEVPNGPRSSPGRSTERGRRSSSTEVAEWTSIITARGMVEGRRLLTDPWRLRSLAPGDRGLAISVSPDLQSGVVSVVHRRV